MLRPDPEITKSTRWVRVTHSDGTLFFYPHSDADFKAMKLINRNSVVDVVDGYGVRAYHSDLHDWDVFLTQEEADQHFEYLADGRVYSAEAA